MFTEENKPLLLEAASIDFQFMKNGIINSGKHTSYELGLYFIKRAVELHGNRYYYGKVVYVNNSTKVTIQCKEHGDFAQKPVYHLGGSNCPKCAGRHSPTTEEFIKRANEVHDNKYTYDISHYSSMHEKLVIVCPQHGPFLQTPAHHINSRAGCPVCSGMCSPTTEEWIAKARNVHGDKYDYSKVTYKSANEKIEIVCYLHGSFFQTPHKHLGFRGCPKCAGHNHNVLYLLKCLDTGWYKIGITTDDVQKRLTSLGGNIEEVHCVELADPRKHETILHKRYEKDREYNLCVKSGNTEFFSLTEEQVQEVIDYMNEVSDG